MEKSKGPRKPILENIENTYLVELISGKETSKGSFWAIDESGSEFYICEGLARENKEQLQDLKNNRTIFWALVQDVVWNGKWKGIKVRSLMMLALEKDKCELFKEKLKERWEFNIAKRRKFEEAIDLVSKDPFDKVFDQLILESQQLDEKSRNTMMDLDNICGGWQDIHK